MSMPTTVRRYTVEELDRFPDDGNRYELVNGVLLVTPGPAEERHAERLVWHPPEMPAPLVLDLAGIFGSDPT
jgi:hypothetical protein